MNEDCKYSNITRGETDFDITMSKIPTTVDIDAILERYDSFMGFQSSDPRDLTYPCCAVTASADGREICSSQFTAKPSKMLETFDVNVRQCNDRIPDEHDQDIFWRDLTGHVDDTQKGRDCKGICNSIEYLANEIFHDINSRDEDRQAVAVIKLLRKYNVRDVEDLTAILTDDGIAGDRSLGLFSVRCEPGVLEDTFKDITDKLDDLGFGYKVENSRVKDLLLFGGRDRDNIVNGQCLYITSLPDYYDPEAN